MKQEELIYERELQILQLKKLSKPQLLNAFYNKQYPDGSVGDNLKHRNRFVVEVGKMVMKKSTKEVINELNKIQ